MTQAALTIVSTTPIARTRTRCIVRSSSSSPSSNNSETPTSLSLHTSSPCHKASLAIQRRDMQIDKTIEAMHHCSGCRNILSFGIASVILGLDLWEGNEGKAAARRPPPPPPEEKKDPNVSGVQAKVLASKKRKEAMKQSMAKQREKGKFVDQQQKPSQVAEQQQKPSQVVEQQPPSQAVEEREPNQVVEQQEPSQVVEEQPSQESSQ